MYLLIIQRLTIAKITHFVTRSRTNETIFGEQDIPLPVMDKIGGAGFIADTLRSPLLKENPNFFGFKCGIRTSLKEIDITYLQR